MSETKTIIVPKFRFKKGYIENLCFLKGFTQDVRGKKKANYAQLAKAIGFTRQYISDLALGSEVRSTEIIKAFAELTGSCYQGWEQPFEIIRTRYLVSSRNFQKNNYAKSLGEMPTQDEINQELAEIARELRMGWRENTKRFLLTKIEDNVSSG